MSDHPTPQPVDTSPIRRANVANIVKKLKAGKTLTAVEMKAIQDLEKEREHLPESANQQEVAALLGITARGLRKIRTEHPDEAPKQLPDGKEDVRAWLAYVRSRPIGPNKVKGTNREALLCRRIEKQIELQEIQIQRARGQLLDLAEVESLHAAIFGTATSTLRQRVENDLPLQMQNKTVPAMRAECRRIVDEVLKGIQKGIEAWAEDRRRREVQADAGADAMQTGEGGGE
jgi:hypothetical protein